MSQNENINSEVKEDNGQINKPVAVEELNNLESVETELKKIDDAYLNSDLNSNLNSNEKEEPTNNEKAENKSPETTPDNAGQVTSDKQKMPIVINDEILSKFSPDDQKILRSFKDKNLDDVLTSYINAQRLIGRKNQQETKQTKEYIPQTDKEKEDVEKTKTELLKSRMLEKYKDYPQNEDELSELFYTNPRKAYEYIQAENLEKQNIKQEVNEVMYLQNNYDVINKNILENSINAINSQLQNFGLTSKDLGIDITVEDTETNILNKMLANSDNTGFDYDIVKLFGYQNKVPIIDEKALQFKFFKEYMPKITELIQTKARTEGFTNATNRTVPPSLSNSGFKGIQKTTNDNNIESITDIKKIDELLEKARF